MDEIGMKHRNWVAFKTIVTKEVVRFMRIWSQTLLPPAITMTLYFLIFGKFIGSQIQDIHGVPYIDFIMPGLVMMSIITNAYANVVSSFFSAKFQKHVEEMLVSPMSHHVILLGYTVGGVLRGLLVGLIVTLVSLCFIHLKPEPPYVDFSNLGVAHPWLTLSMVLMTAVLFSLAGFLNAIYAKKFDDVAIIPTFVLTPMTYLGGVFYSLSFLPDFWQHVSKANPILYMVNAFRYGILGDRLQHLDVGVGTAFLVIGLFITALYTYSIHLLNTGRGIRS